MTSKTPDEIEHAGKQEFTVGKIETHKKNSRFGCTHGLLVVKSCFTFYFFAAGSWWPYVTIFLVSIGITPSQAGLINALRTLASCIGSVIWPLLTDALGGRQTIVLIIISIVTLLSLAPLPWIAVFVNNIIQEDISNNVTNNTNSTLTLNDQAFYCNSECGDNRMFYGMLAIFLVIGLVEMSFIGFLDSNVITLIKTIHKKATYGNQRVFGAIGFAIGSTLSGIAAENFHHSSLSQYSPCIFIFVACFCVFISFNQSISNKSAKRRKISIQTAQNEQKSKLGSLVLETCIKLPNLMFIISAFIGAMSNFGLLSFLFLFMDDNMNASKIAMGLGITTSNIAEVFMFPFANYFIKKFGDMECLIFSIFTNTIRFVILAFITNPWLVLPVQLLHSTGWALFYAAMIHIAHRISPPEIATTMFGIVTGASIGSNLLANLAGGFVYENYGGKTLFLVFAAITFIWGVISGFYFLAGKFLTKCTKK